MKKYSEDKGQWLTHVRADREEWAELIGSRPSDRTLAELGISRAAWLKIAAGKMPTVPIAAHHLAHFRRHGDLSDMLGSAWLDFRVCGDTLLLPGVRQPFSAADLRAVWVHLQELPAMRLELERLRDIADEVTISPILSAWLEQLVRRPLAER